jgi:xylitol oxidase
VKNWAGNLTFSAKEFIEIDNISKLQQVVSNSQGVKVLATGHSFNAIGDTKYTLISLKNLSNGIEIDSQNAQALIPAGMSYADAARYLESNGWAFSNMASLGEVTIAGAISTGTHGSGSNNGVLSTSVVGLEIVLGSGELITIDESNSEEFAGFVISLGSLGVFTKIKMKIVPSFSVKQFVYENIGIQAVAENFDTVFNSAYSVSYFSNWAKNSTGQIWMKFLDDSSSDNLSDNWLGANQAKAKQHPVKINNPDPCTDQLGISGKWLYRLPHFKLDSSPASGDEVQTEYLVDRKYVNEYIQDLRTIGDEIAPRVYATEIRTIKSDELWLSGAYQRETVGFHFTWKKSDTLVDFLPRIEEILGKHDGRPHWAKLFSVKSDELSARYPKYSNFEALLKKYDPKKKFRNKFIDQYFSNY